MIACEGMQPLLLDRAAGLLPPDAGQALEAHLPGCAACRAEAVALDQTLALVRLPPVGADELAALDGLGEALTRARRAGRSRLASWLRLGAGAAVAAAVLAALALPAFWRPVPRITAAELAAARAAVEPAAWVPPDPEELIALAEAVLPAAGAASSAASVQEADVILASAEGWSELFPDLE